eukprot:NODE_731_length_794_cov_491.229530_g555_i0.p1 GENE.NODE_731_length_794_cov_491.229530_g555_i0~~NODE_731_length_794_cov_491.229530_g555_i0.p1  ORF type:complete len:230 (-),score=66.13 NODE_731_length_794_cov_491.229530_g555_i0:104-772(-)
MGVKLVTSKMFTGATTTRTEFLQVWKDHEAMPDGPVTRAYAQYVDVTHIWKELRESYAKDAGAERVREEKLKELRKEAQQNIIDSLELAYRTFYKTCLEEGEEREREELLRGDEGRLSAHGSMPHSVSGGFSGAIVDGGVRRMQMKQRADRTAESAANAIDAKEQLHSDDKNVAEQQRLLQLTLDEILGRIKRLAEEMDGLQTKIDRTEEKKAARSRAPPIV